MEAISREIGCQYFALIHHDDLRAQRTDRVDIRRYPPATTERLISKGGYRRDPIIRGCLFAGGAFVWSDLETIIKLDRQDRSAFELGAREGLNEGITVPYTRLGDCMGSCTFAGMNSPERAERLVGPAQMIGIFAFQAALRLSSNANRPVDREPRLHPRPRDCVVLAGQGHSNKEIARALSLTPRTVDGYLTEARRLFEANDRTELVVNAVLAGEIGLHELRKRQPE
jgi:LuxR family quorum-sensing system transcriptional regulator CciR